MPHQNKIRLGYPFRELTYYYSVLVPIISHSHNTTYMFFCKWLLWFQNSKKNITLILSLSSIRTSYKIHSFESVSRSWLNELLNAHKVQLSFFTLFRTVFVKNPSTLPVAMFFEFEKSILHCQQQ